MEIGFILLSLSVIREEKGRYKIGIKLISSFRFPFLGTILANSESESSDHAIFYFKNSNVEFSLFIIRKLKL
jgi:hypothetical protein